MINRTHMEATFFAWKPTATKEEADQLYREMTSQWETMVNDLTQRACRGFRNQRGTEPTEAQVNELRAQAKHIAKEMVMEDYLAPMTAEIVERETDTEVTAQDRALSTPNGWRENLQDIFPNPTYFSIAEKLWGDQSTLFLRFATALLMRRDRVGLPLPTSTEHPDYDQITAQVMDAVAERKKQEMNMKTTR